MTQHAPSEFGLLRSRWACETPVLLLRQVHGLDVSRETVRRRLHAGALVYRRPRPEVGPTDPERERRLARLRKLLAELPEGETVVRQDEVEVHTNPAIGRMGMSNGRQAVVTTPGTNRKRHLSGSIRWRTGQGFVTEAAPEQGRNAALFIAHLDDLRRRLRRYRTAHVICDNAGCHTSAEVIEYLWRHEGRIEVHLLPPYAPETNPIERVWWLLREHVPRNHRCETPEGLLEMVFAWLEQQPPFTVEDKVYREAMVT